MKTINVGIIGFGYMGNFHLNRCRIIDGLKVIAAYDTDEEKKEDIAEENLKVYNSLDDFLKDDEIDLVIICATNNVHKELSIAALNAGKHVICEKPAMLNVADLEEVLQCAEKNKRLFTAHQNRRWDDDFRVVKEVVDSHTIGQVTTVVSQTFGQRGVCFGWRADPQMGGGMLYDWGVHLIDQLLLLFEEKRVVGIYARLRSILTPVVDDYFEIEMEFEDDIVAHISVGTFCLQDRPRWFVYGDKGTLKLDDFSGAKGGCAKIRDNIRGFRRVKANSTLGPSRTMAHLEKENIEEISLPIVDSKPYSFYQNVINVINGVESKLITNEQMLRCMKVIEATFQSNQEKKRLDVDI